jgi:CheY-like chemotaxis protein
MLLPVLDGWHVLKRLRDEGGRPTVPVVVVTGTILTREWAEQSGCAGFVKKPIDHDALLAEVTRCVGR